MHDMRVNEMEHDGDLDEEDHDDDHEEKSSMDSRKLRKRARQFFCDDDGESSAPEDDLEDADGPENLCIKNTRDSNNDGAGNNNNNKDHSSSNKSNGNNANRIGLGK